MAATTQETDARKTRRTPTDSQMQFSFDAPALMPVVHPPEPGMPATARRKPAGKTAKKTESVKTASSRARAKAVADSAANAASDAKPPLPPLGKGGSALQRGRKGHKYATAESMSKAQREISVSEFFAKNRHLLGFDNKRKALLTTVKEAVDNSLDACEEAGILPDIVVKIEQSDQDRFRVTVRDNGPGIVKAQIPNVFGKLLYGSKFHRLKMSRGQQGIGISAAGMYGLLTTGKSVKITSRTGAKSEAHYYELQIDTKKNAPHIVTDKTVKVDWPHGTEVTIELESQYQKGRASVDEYLELTAIANPHASFTFVDPAGQVTELPGATSEMPAPTIEIKPHPYGIELGVLIKMLKDSREKKLSRFLSSEFSRVSGGTASAICDKAKLSARANPTRIGTHEAETLYKAMQETQIRPPSTDCLSPIGEKQILAGLLKGVKAEFFTAATRSPAVYRGNPFQIEVGLAYGGELGPDPSDEPEAAEAAAEAKVRRGKVVEAPRATAQTRLMRFANRVPLLYQMSGCCIYKSMLDTDWRRYGLSQPSGSLPQAPLAVFVHMASVWVPFTSEGKEAIADYDEIRKEIKLAVQECGRKLQSYLNRRKKQKYETDRRSIFNRYIGEVVSACSSITKVNEKSLFADLSAVAQRITARADEETELIAADGTRIRGKAGRARARADADAEPLSSEYGENTVVVERNADAGPLFNGAE